jgi:outer membrane lipoprotein-sorting protein
MSAIVFISTGPSGRILLAILALCMSFSPAIARDGEVLVRRCIDHLRGRTSEAVVTMTIHRPDWERVMTLRGWTRGMDASLIRVLAPARDRGNATLKLDRSMWVFNPKINRVIKLPPSMMSQSWMGSDFSNNDLARSETLVSWYTHEVVTRRDHDGVEGYVVRSVPLADAPVVWGAQVLWIRVDGVLLSQEFLDERGRTVKTMTGRDVIRLGGRIFPREWTMRRAGKPDSFTRLVYDSLTFDVDIPDSVFTISNLRTGR